MINIRSMIGILAIGLGLGCAMEIDEPSHHPAGRDTASPTISVELVQAALERAPSCDELNQDRLHRDTETRILLQCDAGLWIPTDLETYFASKPVSKSINVYYSYWTAFNAYDGTVFVDCGWNGGRPGMITGVQSYHHNHYEDRRFSYECSFIYDY